MRGPRHRARAGGALRLRRSYPPRLPVRGTHQRRTCSTVLCVHPCTCAYSPTVYGGHVARETDAIERDIERAREELASTLDELATRPKRMADSLKDRAKASMSSPAVRYGLIGAGVLVAGLVVIKIVR